jgi:hypothetical protein
MVLVGKPVGVYQRGSSGMQRVELVEAVKAYATEHRNEGQWNIIADCWSDRMIADCLKPTPYNRVLREYIGDTFVAVSVSTPGTAIKRFRKIIATLDPL